MLNKRALLYFFDRKLRLKIKTILDFRSCWLIRLYLLLFDVNVWVTHRTDGHLTVLRDTTAAGHEPADPSCKRGSAADLRRLSAALLRVDSSTDGLTTVSAPGLFHNKLTVVLKATWFLHIQLHCVPGDLLIDACANRGAHICTGSCVSNTDLQNKTTQFLQRKYFF